MLLKTDTELEKDISALYKLGEIHFIIMSSRNESGTACKIKVRVLWWYSYVNNQQE